MNKNIIPYSVDTLISEKEINKRIIELGEEVNLFYKETKKLLVVGGTGFLGFHIIKKAKKKNWKITSISLKKPTKKICHSINLQGFKIRLTLSPSLLSKHEKLCMQEWIF